MGRRTAIRLGGGFASVASALLLPFTTLGQAASGIAQLPAGIGNFHRVNDALFRGAQPTAEGIKNLAQLGIRTILDLRMPGERSDAEARQAESLGMRYIRIPLSNTEAPSDQDVVKGLSIMLDPSQAPVFVHCQRGADRTGTLVACYRIQHDGWDNRKAFAEARGYGMWWYEFGMRRFILNFMPAVTAASSHDPLASPAAGTPVRAQPSPSAAQ